MKMFVTKYCHNKSKKTLVKDQRVVSVNLVFAEYKKERNLYWSRILRAIGTVITVFDFISDTLIVNYY